MADGENGLEVHDEAVDEPQPSELEQEIQLLLDTTLERIATLCELKSPIGQPQEVAAAFLCDARGLARAGKEELARRKLAAARNVLNGGKSD